MQENLQALICKMPQEIKKERERQAAGERLISAQFIFLRGSLIKGSDN